MDRIVGLGQQAMLEGIRPAELFAVLLIFVWADSALMLLPGFGEPLVSPRLRLLLVSMIACWSRL